MRESTPTRVNRLDGAGLGLRRQFLDSLAASIPDVDFFSSWPGSE